MYPITPLLNPKIMTKKYNPQNISSMFLCGCVFVVLLLGILGIVLLVDHETPKSVGRTNTTNINNCIYAGINFCLLSFIIFFGFIGGCFVLILILKYSESSYDNNIDMDLYQDL